MKKRLLSIDLITVLLITLSFTGCSFKPTPTDASEFEYTVYEQDKTVVIDKFIGKSKDVVVPEEIEEIHFLGDAPECKADYLPLTQQFIIRKTQKVRTTKNLKTLF